MSRFRIIGFLSRPTSSRCTGTELSWFFAVVEVGVEGGVIVDFEGWAVRASFLPALRRSHHEDRPLDASSW